MNQGLRNGATIVTMPRFDLDQFLSLLDEHGVTRTYVVPPIAVALAKHPAIDAHDLSSVRTIMSGAAPLGAELAEKVAERLDCDVIQGYGMTETSPVTHVIRPEHNKPGSIGPAIPSTECRLVDPETGEDVGEGERGELWVRGPQVMQGYLNNAEATAGTIDAEGWLHTGDIAVIDSDGFFEIVDRLKELIKYKGFQVAPAELEALIQNHPDVADVAVSGVPDEECGELPKAYVVPAGEELRLRGADGVGRGSGLAAEEGPDRGGGRGDPEVAVGEDPPPRPQGPREGRLGLVTLSAAAAGVPPGAVPRASSRPRWDSPAATVAHPAQLAEQALGRARAVPVVVLGAADPPHVLDDDVLGPDRDLAAAAGTAIELLRDRADQPRLVALVGVADEARPRVRQILEAVHVLDCRRTTRR